MLSGPAFVFPSAPARPAAAMLQTWGHLPLQQSVQFAQACRLPI